MSEAILFCNALNPGVPATAERDIVADALELRLAGYFPDGFADDGSGRGIGIDESAHHVQVVQVGCVIE